MPRKRRPDPKATAERFSEPLFVDLSDMPEARADRIRVQNEAMVRARLGDPALAIELGLFPDPDSDE